MLYIFRIFEIIINTMWLYILFSNFELYFILCLINTINLAYGNENRI